VPRDRSTAMAVRGPLAVAVDDPESPVEVIGRQTAARRIALALHRGRHHLIACTGWTGILSTVAALHGASGVLHYLDTGHDVTVAPAPLDDDVRDDLRHGIARWSVSVVPVASMTTGILAGRLGCAPAPDTTPAVFHRRPASYPERPPALLREAFRRLAASRAQDAPGRRPA
jgi:hypothetical protein